jgi:hypothetical protein
MRHPTILLVEDNDAAAELTAMAFREAKVANPVLRLEDGVEALDYLFGRGKLYRPVQNGEIPSSKMGRVWRFCKQGVRQRLEQQRAAKLLKKSRMRRQRRGQRS